MGILNTFYLLFKADTTGARTEMGALEKQIDALKEKGKKRTEQESKDLKELLERQKELSKAIEESEEQAEKLKNAIIGATGAMFGFNAAREGITNSNKFNSDLRVQGELLNQNAEDLKVYGAAAEAAGGSVQGLQSDVQKWYNSAVTAGIKPGKFSDYLENVRKDLKNFQDFDQKNQRLDTIGITDPGLRRMLLSDKEFSERMSKARQNVSINGGDLDAARESEATVSGLRQVMDSFWTKVSTHLPAAVNAGLSEFGKTIGTAGAGIAGWVTIPKLTAWARGLFAGGAAVEGAGAAAGITAAGIAAPAAIVAAAVAAIDLIWRGKKSVIGGMFNSDEPEAAKPVILFKKERPMNREQKLNDLDRLFNAGQEDGYLEKAKSPFGDQSSISPSKSVNISIAKIDVNTQATDAHGIANDLGTQLSSMLGNLAAGFDDGVNA